MEMKEEHKRLLREMGLQEEDFQYFDGRLVTYECDETLGVRFHDPYYTTSYREYIGVDGWSAWSSEKDTFMSGILEEARAEAERREKGSPKPTQEEISRSLEQKFLKKEG